MTQQEIIEISKKFGMTVELASHPAVKQLVNEVVKQTENRFMQLFLDPENQPTQFGTATQEYREQEIKEEREACAKICEELSHAMSSVGEFAAKVCAKFIREQQK